MIHFLRSRNESSTLSLNTVIYTLFLYIQTCVRATRPYVIIKCSASFLNRITYLLTQACLFREEHKPTMTIFSTVCVVSYFCEPLVQYVTFFRFVIFCNRILFYKTKSQAPTLKFRLNTRNSNSSRQKTNLRKGEICCGFVQFNSERLQFSIYD